MEGALKIEEAAGIFYSICRIRFQESHAAAYAMIAYQTAYLKLTFQKILLHNVNGII